MMIPHSTRYISLALLCSAALLSACAPVGRGVQRVGTAIHETSVDIDRRLSKALDSENAEMQRNQRKETPPPVYCYRSLGDISCYNKPLAGEESRLAGKQIPPSSAFDPMDYPSPQQRPQAVFMDVESTPQRKEVFVDAVTIHAPESVQVTTIPAPHDASPPPPVTPVADEPQELMPQLP